MIAPAAYIRRETVVSIVINVVISLGFFLLIFGLTGPVGVWGIGGYVFDFAPQGFMIALMATLVPGLLTIRARRQGKIDMALPPADLSNGLLLRALGLAAAGAGAGVAIAAAGMTVAGLSMLAWWPALIAKLIFGGVLAWLVTPIGLRALLTAR